MGKKRTIFRTPEQHRAKTAHLPVDRLPEIEPVVYARLNPLETWALMRELGFRSYQEYLYSALWIVIRQKVLKKAKGRCEYCCA